MENVVNRLINIFSIISLTKKIPLDKILINRIILFLCLIILY